MINLTLKEITNEFNGYGMPKVIATADKDITVINRGYNCFEATEQINEGNLSDLLSKIDRNKHDTVHIEINMPGGKTTCCWYDIKFISEKYDNMMNGKRIMW